MKKVSQMQRNINHSNKWDIVVPIKNEFLKNKPFEGKGITARTSTAIILSYFGFSIEVLSLMQELSHKTRAYIWNADGLPGFLITADLIQVLTVLDAKGELENVTRYQDIKLDEIKNTYLRHINLKGQLDFLQKFYPGLYVLI